jgi:hypothetical protein
MKNWMRFWNNIGNLALIVLVGSVLSAPSAVAAQQSRQSAMEAKQNAAAKKLSPEQIKEQVLKLVAEHKTSGTITPIALTPAKLKHQDVLLKLQKQKQTVDSLRMTILASARKKGLPSSQATLARGGTGGAVEPNQDAVNSDPGGLPGTKSGQRASAQSKITPATNIGAAQSGSTTKVSPVTPMTNPNVAAVAVCNGPTIDTVNGQVKGAWFSPDPQYNHYTIQGCGFGDQQGGAHLYGPFATPTVSLAIEFWSDSSIIAAMDPNITSESDHLGNVTLVVAPVNAKQVQSTGLNFYAARQDVQLMIMPRSQISLQTITDAGRLAVPTTLVSPTASPSNSNVLGLGGALGSALRSAPSGTIGRVVRSEWGRFGSAQDSFNFGQLTPGFYPDKYEFWHSDITQSDCSAFGSQTELYIDGNWSVTWDGSANALRVTTQEQHCHERGIGGFSENDFSLSDYWLAVWVVGPRGVNPWPTNLQ